MRALDAVSPAARSPWGAVMPRGANGAPVNPTDTFVPSAPGSFQPTLPIPGFESAAPVAGAAMPGAVGAAVRFVLLGPPGSGKSTQGEILAKEQGVPHVSVGDLVRDEIAAGTEIGKKLEQQVDGGDLAAPELVLELVRDRLTQEDALQGFVLDGYPRQLQQIPHFEKLREELDWGPVALISLQLDEDEAVRRLTGRGRQDDTPEVIHHRLEVYRQETAPVQEYYGHRSEFVPIDASGSIEDVAARIRRAVNP